MTIRLPVVIAVVAVCAALACKADAAESPARTPRFDVRAIHLSLMKSTGPADKVKETKDDVIRTIRSASRAGFNTVIFLVTGAVRLQKTPSYATQWAFSISELREITAAARNAGMEVIPQLHLLTHQDRFVGLMDGSLMLSKGDYDPTNPLVYEKLFPVIDEIADIFKPVYFHIGHDEVYATSRNVRFSFLRRLLTPDEFLADVVRIKAHLDKRGIKTVMWADMLLSPDRFGGVYDNRSVNGVDGYEKIIDRLPKDIILCDWHYEVKGREFPSYTYLQSKGFVVWGAVWKDTATIKAFSDYVAKHGRSGEGMIATTWWDFVSQDRDVVDGIISDSSNAFFE